MRYIRDMPIHGRFVDIEFKMQRFDCRACGRGGLNEDLSRNIHLSHEMTTRLVAYIEEQSVRRTFASVAEEVGLAEITISRIFEAHADAYMTGRKLIVPRVLGIDDKVIDNKYHTVLGDLERRTALDIVGYKDKKSLAAFLKALGDDRWKIKAVCLDMDSVYFPLVQKELPWAKIVIDKYHVLAPLNDAVDKARIDSGRSFAAEERRLEKEDLLANVVFVRKPLHGEIVQFLKTNRRMFLVGGPGPKLILQMKQWLNLLPELDSARIHAQEFLIVFYECLRNRSDAKSFLRDWRARLTAKQREYFKDFLSRVEKYEEYILNYWGFPITNAYMESLNSAIAYINHAGRKYSFKVLRAKLLMLYGQERAPKKKFQRIRLKGIDFD